MTVYLAYRLQRAGVGPLARVWLLDTGRGWLAADLSDELARLFPGLEMLVSPLPAEPGCDLAVIPFDRKDRDLAWRWSTVRQVARSRPRFIGLYEVGKRRLVVFNRRSTTAQLIRMIAEHWIVRWRALVGRAGSRASSLVSSRGSDP